MGIYIFILVILLPISFILGYNMSKREMKLHGQSPIRTPLKLGDNFYYLVGEREFNERKLLTIDRREEFELVASTIEELVYVINTTKSDYVKYTYLTNARRYLNKVIKDFEKIGIKHEEEKI